MTAKSKGILDPLSPARVRRDPAKIVEEVVTHSVGLIGASVGVILEIKAEIPKVLPTKVVRTITENVSLFVSETRTSVPVNDR
jgi:hypothetical protein